MHTVSGLHAIFFLIPACSFLTFIHLYYKCCIMFALHNTTHAMVSRLQVSPMYMLWSDKKGGFRSKQVEFVILLYNHVCRHRTAKKATSEL